MIDIRNVSKVYGDTSVVDDVSFQIPARGVTSIIGPNGAGKSTLLSMISRLSPMTRGTVLVDGMNVATTASNVLARKLAILRQENTVSLRLTVRDLIAYGRYPYSRGRLSREDGEHIQNAIHYLNLQDLADRFLDELSGGQRQRAFVAMVLCQDTSYVLLDEPLNNLDMKNSVGIMKLLRRMADELGKTIILVLHDINFASCYSDFIVAMKGGRIAHAGSPSELIQSQILQSIYDIDMAVHLIGEKRICAYYD